MESKASSHALARSIVADARARQCRFTLREAGYEYLGWFEREGKPHLFEEELRELQ